YRVVGQVVDAVYLAGQLIGGQRHVGGGGNAALDDLKSVFRGGRLVFLQRGEGVDLAGAVHDADGFRVGKHLADHGKLLFNRKLVAGSRDFAHRGTVGIGQLRRHRIRDGRVNDRKILLAGGAVGALRDWRGNGADQVDVLREEI